MKNLFYALLFFILNFSHLSAKNIPDSLLKHKFGFGYNLFPGLTNAEAGLNFEFRLHKNIFLEASYYHTYYGFKIVVAGASNAFEYNPTFGDKFQIGLRFYNKHKKSSKIFFYEYRIGYKNLTTPTYTNRDGSNGLNGTPREVLSIYRDFYRVSFAVGEKQFIGKHFYLEEIGGIGLQYIYKKEHLYSHGQGNQYQYVYPPNTYRKSRYFFPMLEISIRFGMLF
ncbi:MAG: hypothetical protein IPP64_08185 [Bacteroidetes bacterium]|nr:hypothetical protein [Bacteroidota bacterium]